MESNVDQEKGNENPTNYNLTNMSSNWPLNDNNLPNTMPNSCSSKPITDSFCPPIWDHSISGQNLGYGDVNAMLRGSVFMPSVPLMVPQSLPHFPADSGFIERASRLSCFSGGNFGDMMNPFTVAGNLNSYSRVLESMQGEMNNAVENERMRECLQNEAKRRVGTSANDSHEAEYSSRGDHEGSPGESSIKGVGSSKRKRVEENRELNENNRALEPSVEAAKDDAEIEQKRDPNPASTSKPSGKNGKQGSQGSDLGKEEYIRVRARRGQATNSHSLAERLRREKISERMKFLQDLVPGCSKVTGKAVMLDEIINYVQSLQRQVEFLSMKLATVNPRLNFNIDGLLTKDIVQSRFGPSSSVPLPPDMTMPYPLLHQTPHGLIQPGLSVLGSPSNTLRRSTHAPFTSAFREPTSQVPSLWEDELHSVVQMGISFSAPLSSQDLSGSLSSGQVKAEP